MPVPTDAITPSAPKQRELRQLSDGAYLVISCMRAWSNAARRAACPQAAIERHLFDSGCEHAAPYLDELMTLLAVTARRPIVIHCRCQPRLSDDEDQLLQVLWCIQSNQYDKPLDYMGQMLHGNLARTFCRTAGLVIQILDQRGLNFRPKPMLAVVS